MALRLSEGLGITDARTPVTGLSAFRRDCDNDNLGVYIEIYDGEVEFLREHAASTEEVGRPEIRELGRKVNRLLYCGVESFAKPAADGNVKPNFVNEFSARFVVEADRVHL